jgi:hypothetical protein
MRWATRLKIERAARDVLDRWGKPAVLGARRRAVYTWARGFARRLVENTPQGTTGNLRREWRTTPYEKGMVVENVADYAVWVNDGTGLYGPMHRRIVPRNGSVLAWKGQRAPSAYRLGPSRRAAYARSGIVVRSTRGMKGRKMYQRTLAEKPPRVEFPKIMIDELARTFLQGPAA